MHNPKVSVVIPTYNCANFISDAIESVLNQTYNDYEIIIVDDGSTDDTAEIIAQYKSQSCLKYFYKTNNGQASARNYALQNAVGEIVCFLDADDTWMPKKLELQVPLFDSPQIGAAHTGVVCFDSESMKNITVDNNLIVPTPLKSGKIIAYLLIENYIAHSTLMARKQLLLSIGGFDENIKMGDDWDIVLRLSAECEFGYIDEELARYRVGRPNCVSEKVQLRFNQDIKILQKIVQQHNAILSKQVIDAAFARRYRERAYYFSDKDLARSLIWYLRAMLLQPGNVLTYKGIITSFYKCSKFMKKK